MKKFTREDIRKTFKSRDAVWTVWGVDPIVERILPTIANRTKLTPNQLTLIAFILGTLAVYFFFLGDRVSLIIAALLAEMGFVFDCMDGKLARLKGPYANTGKYAPLGIIADYATDKTLAIMRGFALGYGQWRLTGDVSFLILSFIYTSLHLYVILISMWYMKTGIEPGDSPIVKVLSSSGRGFINWFREFTRRHRILPIPSSVETGTILYFFAPILGQVRLGYFIAIPIIFLVIVYTVLVLVLKIIKSKGNDSSTH